jgi:tetratricopeptide (TPR) repeat protein
LVGAISDLPQEQVAAIARRSGGNPLFAVELASANDLDDGHPDSIEALITSRIDRLGHDTRAIVRAGAVLGQRFDVALLAEILNQNVEAELTRLDRLVDLADGHATFRSAIVREVAYQGLSIRRRRQLHGAVADALDGRTGTEVAELAHHHAEAGNHDQAWTLGRRAAAEAGRRGLLDLAYLRLRPAVQAAEQVANVVDDELVAALIDLFEYGIAVGRRADAIGFGRRAIALVDDPVERTRLLGRVATETAVSDGSYQTQADLLRAELDRIGTGDEQAARRARIGPQLAGLLFRTTAWDEAVTVAEAAIADAERAGLAAPLATAVATRFIVWSNRADPRRVEQRPVVIQTAERAGDGLTLIRAHNNVGTDYERSGRWAEAIEHYERAAEVAAVRGDTHSRLIPDMNRAVLLSQQGHWGEARNLLEEVRRQARHQRAAFIEARAQLELARVEIAAGLLDEANRWIEQSRPFFEEAANAAVLHELDLLAINADLMAGRSDKVLAAIDALSIPADLESDLIGLPTTMAALAHLQLGNHRRAVELAERAVDDVVDGNRFGLALALTARAEAATALGQIEVADRSRRAAGDILAGLDVKALPSVPLP